VKYWLLGFCCLSSSASALNLFASDPVAPKFRVARISERSDWCPLSHQGCSRNRSGAFWGEGERVVGFVCVVFVPSLTGIVWGLVLNSLYFWKLNSQGSSYAVRRSQLGGARLAAGGMWFQHVGEEGRGENSPDQSSGCLLGSEAAVRVVLPSPQHRLALFS